LGDTIIGTKGRVAFEAPAAEVLLNAHRELEKLVLSAAPAARQGNASPARTATWVHEGQLLDPVCSRHRSAVRVLAAARHGEVHVLFAPRLGVLSRASSRRISLMAASKGVYGEADRRMEPCRCARLLAASSRLPGMFHRRAGERPTRAKK
jgi:argininosuccinate synthase